MPADITLILNAVKAALAEARPSVPVRTSKRRAGGGKQLQGGLQAGLPVPCLVLSCGDPEEVDKLASFEHVSVGYRVVVEYVKSAQAKVPGAADTGAATVVEDPDVRDTRDAIRGALYRTIAAVPGAFDTRTRALAPYESPGEGPAVYLVSGEEFTFTTMAPRPGAI